MIAIDTSTWIAFLSGQRGADVDAADEALSRGSVVLPPVVLTELLSNPESVETLASVLSQIPLLSVLDGYWERAGRLRAKVQARRLRARLADTLIAQSCVDHGAPLLTRDKDFRHFVRYGGLELAVPPRRAS